MGENNGFWFNGSWLKVICSTAIGILFGIWILYTQLQQDLHHRELKLAGQTTVGILTGVTRHGVNFIPVAYSFQISYAGQSKKFDVSKSLFNAHVSDDGKFKVNEKISVFVMPNQPDISELPEMLDLLIWWCGGPLLNYPFGVIVVLGSVLGMAKYYKNRRAEH